MFNDFKGCCHVGIHKLIWHFQIKVLPNGIKNLVAIFFHKDAKAINCAEIKYHFPLRDMSLHKDQGELVPSPAPSVPGKVMPVDG